MTPSEVAHTFLAAAERHDTEGMLALMAPEVVLDDPQNGLLRGTDAVRRAMASWSGISNQRITRESAEGDKVRLQGTLDAAGYGTVSAEWTFTVVGGKVTRLDVWGE